MRFPDKAIRNKTFSASDAQGGFFGDFELGNTVFHVTVAPSPELYTKCKMNLDRGQRIYLIVLEDSLFGTKQNADSTAPGMISVVSIESFIATNIDELSDFEGSKLVSGLRRLLEKYNDRVDEVELDKSILIDIPPNLE